MVDAIEEAVRPEGISHEREERTTPLGSLRLREVDDGDLCPLYCA